MQRISKLKKLPGLFMSAVQTLLNRVPPRYFTLCAAFYGGKGPGLFREGAGFADMLLNFSGVTV